MEQSQQITVVRQAQTSRIADLRSSSQALTEGFHLGRAQESDVARGVVLVARFKTTLRSFVKDHSVAECKEIARAGMNVTGSYT